MFDPSENEVTTKYFNSLFLGHYTAESILKEFYEKLSNH